MRSPNKKMPLSVNRAKPSHPFRSQLCLLHQRGRCHYGENCHYAHSLSDVKKPGFGSVSAERHFNEDKGNPVGEMRRCFWFSTGEVCPYGGRCTYLHEDNQKVCGVKSLHEEGFGISAMNGGRDGDGKHQIDCRSSNCGERCVKNIFYKTRLCRRWEAFGNCPLGLRCDYAHGRSELQKLSSRTVMKCGYTSASKVLVSRSKRDTSCEVGIRTATKLRLKPRYSFMKWNVEKIGRVYADWMEDKHMSPCSHE